MPKNGDAALINQIDLLLDELKQEPGKRRTDIIILTLLRDMYLRQVGEEAELKEYLQYPPLLYLIAKRPLEVIPYLTSILLFISAIYITETRWAILAFFGLPQTLLEEANQVLFPVIGFLILFGLVNGSRYREKKGTGGAQVGRRSERAAEPA